MLYLSCFQNMPTREKELQGFFYICWCFYPKYIHIMGVWRDVLGAQNIFSKNTAVQLPSLDTCLTHLESVFIFVWLGYCLQ
jgi:hypothetical protein